MRTKSIVGGGACAQQHADELAAQGFSGVTVEAVQRFDPEAPVPVDFVVALVQRIHVREREGAVLVFLPGWDDITKVHDGLQSAQTRRGERAFQHTAAGRCVARRGASGFVRCADALRFVWRASRMFLRAQLGSKGRVPIAHVKVGPVGKCLQSIDGCTLGTKSIEGKGMATVLGRMRFYCSLCRKLGG